MVYNAVLLTTVKLCLNNRRNKSTVAPVSQVPYLPTQRSIAWS